MTFPWNISLRNSISYVDVECLNCIILYFDDIVTIKRWWLWLKMNDCLRNISLRNSLFIFDDIFINLVSWHWRNLHEENILKISNILDSNWFCNWLSNSLKMPNNSRCILPNYIENKINCMNKNYGFQNLAMNPLFKVARLP